MAFTITCDNCYHDFYNRNMLPKITDCSECGVEMCENCEQERCSICKEILCSSCFEGHEETHKEEEGESDEQEEN